MPILTNLIRSLSKYEVRIVRSITQITGNVENKKRDQLFELIHQGSCEEQVALLIGYKSAKVPAFINLCQRLQQDILNALLIVQQTPEEDSPFLQAQFGCRRALLFADILQSRNCFDEADALLERTSRTAKRCELFAEQVLINDLRRNTPAVQQNPALFNQLSLSLAVYHNQQGDVLKARQMHYELLSPELIRSVSMADFQQQGMLRLSEMSRNLKQSDSDRLKFYYHLAAMNFHTTIRCFEDAEMHGGELLKLIAENTLLQSDGNVAAVNIELAGINLAGGNNKAAGIYARQAIDAGGIVAEQQLQATRLLALSQFRSGNHNAAADTITAALRRKETAVMPLAEGRLRLLYAAVALEQKAYKDSAAMIARCSELAADFRGWMPGYFLLDLQLNLERGLIDVAEHRLDAFRHTVRRHQLDGKNGDKRLTTIVFLLNRLFKLNIGYKSLRDKEQQHIQLLKQNESDYWWNPAGYELIRFDQWLLNRAS
jgi:hypothetical protein